jgi:membrane associated rhomboid family serine protease
MDITLLYILLISTVALSLSYMDKPDSKEKLMFVPYLCKHDNQGYRVFTHLFIHADYAHLAFNMFSFYFLGKSLEQNMILEYGFWQGELHFFMLYFLGGLFATTIPYLRNSENPSYRSLGASGAVSAVVFAFIIWNPNASLSLLFIPIPMPAYVFGILYLAFEYYSDKKKTSNIAHDAHLGGAIFGIIYILIINFEKGKKLLDIIL